VQLRSAKPVVTSVRNLAASGSYYMAIGSNYIFAKPAALVGSIGVVAGIPDAAGPSEFQATTGPFKTGGSTAVDWIRGMEVLKDAFVGHVYEQRVFMLEHMHADSRAEWLPGINQIGTGQVWFAPVAYDIGLIDELGSDLDAIRKAAELAHVSNYEVVDLTGLVIYGEPEFYFGAEARNNALDWAAELQSAGPWPSFFHLYLPPQE
jgi:protease-4